MNSVFNFRNFVTLTFLFILKVLAAHSVEQTIPVLIKEKSVLGGAKKSPTGSVVFYSKDYNNSQDPQIKAFLESFHKAAIALNDFGVKFYAVDCSDKSNGIQEECSSSRDYVVAYSTHQKQEFDIPLLFDEDHVVGHVLMFILKYDIAIAQDKYSWDEVLTNSKGRKDILLGYFRGIGDRDHRLFMETAFVYGKEYQFVITTSSEMPGLQSDGSMWLYKCKDVSQESDCTHKSRQMPPKSVLDVIRFLKLDGISRIVEIEADGSNIFDQLDMTFPLNKVFLFSSDLKAIRKMAAEALKSIDDSFYFILVDVTPHTDLLPEFGINLAQDWDDGAITLVLQPAHLVGSDEKYYEQWPAHLDFTLKNLIDVLNQYHKNPNDAYQEIVSAVDVVYYPVNDWKKPKQGFVIVGGCMKELPECSAFNIVFRRIVRSIFQSELEEIVTFDYVDFTESPDNAKVNTLPGFIFYKQGKQIKYKGEMDYESLLHFLWENVSKSIRRLPLSGSDHLPISKPEEEQAEKGDVDESDGDGMKKLLAMEDDAMGKLAVDIVKRNVKDEDVIALTDKTFNNTRDANELMVTLFYLPWCVKSIILRESYAKLVRRFEMNLSNKNPITALNKVNCFDWEDVCSKENVISYPTIKVYRKGHETISYSGSFDVESLETAIKNYQRPIVKELTDSKSVHNYLDINVPSNSPVSVLGLFASENDKELKIFKNSAEALFGKYPFAYASGSIAKESAKQNDFAIPSLVLVKRSDPLSKFSSTKDFKILDSFIEERSLPLYGELLAVNFPKYKKFGRPFLIQFRDKNETVNNKALENLALKTEEIFVVWMDKSKKVTQEIMRAYAKDVLNSALVLVNHNEGKVYKFDGEITDETLIAWVKDCLKGSVNPTYELVEKEWRPLRKPYDYLKLIQEKQKTDGDPTEEQDVASVEVGDGDSYPESEQDENDEGNMDKTGKEDGEEEREKDNVNKEGDDEHNDETPRDEL